jgi:hypothetical protein
MLRAVRLLLGAFAAVLTLAMLLVAVSAVSFRLHQVTGSEREHLEAAVQFLQERKVATGTLPESEEFGRWARSIDSKGYFRYEGHGYTLNKQCSSEPSEFCIHFWTGDDWVTYRSWQGSMEKVRLDDWPPSYALVLLLAAVLAGVVSKLLILHGNRNGRRQEAHEG